MTGCRRSSGRRRCSCDAERAETAAAPCARGSGAVADGGGSERRQRESADARIYQRRNGVATPQEVSASDRRLRVTSSRGDGYPKQLGERREEARRVAALLERRATVAREREQQQRVMSAGRMAGREGKATPSPNPLCKCHEPRAAGQVAAPFDGQQRRTDGRAVGVAGADAGNPTAGSAVSPPERRQQQEPRSGGNPLVPSSTAENPETSRTPNEQQRDAGEHRGMAVGDGLNEKRRAALFPVRNLRESKGELKKLNS